MLQGSGYVFNICMSQRQINSAHFTDGEVAIEGGSEDSNEFFIK